jgi:hypothetical protein
MQEPTQQEQEQERDRERAALVEPRQQVAQRSPQQHPTYQRNLLVVACRLVGRDGAVRLDMAEVRQGEEGESIADVCLSVSIASAAAAPMPVGSVVRLTLESV